ncbi:MAG: NHLP-related RiPP peptide [Dokdonella sp.]
MSDASLTTADTLKLLYELASNDQFRQRYADKPAAAMVELGIPHETVINLNASCLAPCGLASKDSFKEAHAQYLNSDVARTQSMAIPQLRLSRGAPDT